MSKIKCLPLLLAGILSFGVVQAQWNLEKCPAKNNLNAISMFDINSGWIVGDKGTMVYRSGGNWKEYQKFTNEDLNSVFMVDRNDAWIVGSNGTIFHYNGKDWESYNSPTGCDLFSVSFRDPENGIAVGDLGTILVYRNGSWNLSESGIRGKFYSVFFREDEAWIGGGLECVNVPIMKVGITKNEDFLINSVDPNATIKSIIFLSPENGWAAGSPSTLLHFNGLQWEKAGINNDFSSLNSIFFSKENKGIGVGYGGTILTCTDNLWNKEKIMTNQNLNGAVIIGNRYIAVGDSGTIISRDQGSENILNDPYNSNTGIIKIYPNPCDEFLNVIIPSEIDNLSIRLTVSNSSGEIIMQKELRSSTICLTYTLVTSDFKDGLYFIKTAVGSRTIVNKFIVRH